MFEAYNLRNQCKELVGKNIKLRVQILVIQKLSKSYVHYVKTVK